MEHLIIWIMLSHWVADFLCQTSWMAENKSKNFLALLSHGLVYTGMLAYMVMMLGGRMGMEYTAMGMFILINGLSHVGVDFFTSKITSYFWRTGRIHNFFVTIGLDQYIHFVILYVTMWVYLVP